MQALALILDALLLLVVLLLLVHKYQSSNWLALQHQQQYHRPATPQVI